MIEYEYCYPRLIEKELRQEGYKIRLINYSVGGAHSWGGMDMVSNLFNNESPDLVIIVLGVNDAFQKIPVSNTLIAFDKMIKTCKQHNCPIILGTVDFYWSRGIVKNVDDYNHIYSYLSDKYNITLFDFITKNISNSFTIDGIHPNKEGHRLIWEELKKVLIPILSK